MMQNRIVLRKGLIIILTLVLVMQSGVCVFAQEENSNTETCSGWAKAEVAEAVGERPCAGGTAERLSKARDPQGVSGTVRVLFPVA